MQGQYQPRAPGIAAGQSNRDTLGTYFDYQGIMRTAHPGELRPNYVYKNGIWVQDGWLREGMATNYVNNLLSGYGEGTTDILGTKTRVQLTTNYKYALNPVYSGVSASCVLSAYVTVKGGIANVNCDAAFSYTSYVKIDDAGNILDMQGDGGQGHAQTPSAYYIGDGMYRLSFPRTDGFSALGVTSANVWLASTTSGTQATATCELVQLEDGDTATSLIPTNGTPATRTAD